MISPNFMHCIDRVTVDRALVDRALVDRAMFDSSLPTNNCTVPLQQGLSKCVRLMKVAIPPFLVGKPLNLRLKILDN